MDSLLKTVQSTLDAVFAWLSCVRHPYITAQKISSPEFDDQKKLRGAFGIWGAAFAIALVMQLPMYKLFGIDIKDIHFHLPNIVGVLLIIFGGACFVHWSLRLHKIDSKFSDTVAIYTIIVGAFSPILVMLSYPDNLKKLYAVQHVKHANLPAKEAIATYLRDMGPGDSYTDYIAGFCQPFIGLASAIFLAMLANALCQHYGAEKFRVVSSIGVGIAVFLPIVGLINWLGVALLYVAIQ
jgi:hypothetical protein